MEALWFALHTVERPVDEAKKPIPTLMVKAAADLIKGLDAPMEIAAVYKKAEKEKEKADAGEHCSPKARVEGPEGPAEGEGTESVAPAQAEAK